MSSPFLDRAIEKGVLFLIVFPALTFGGVHDWAAAVMEIAAFAVIAAWLLRQTGQEAALIADRRLLLLGGGLVLVVLLQLLPLPEPVLRALSPGSADIYRDSANDPPGAWRSISLSSWSTRQYLLKLLVYIGIFFVVAGIVRTTGQAIRLVKFLVLFGCSLVVFAIIQKASWNGRIYWLYPVPWDSAVVWGPFINRNHFAGYLGLIIPLGLALVLDRAAHTNVPGGRSLQDRAAALIASRSFSVLGLWGILTLVLVAAVFLTLSRGGIVALLASMAMLFVLARMRRGLGRPIRAVVIAGLLLLLMVVLAGADRIGERFERMGADHVNRFAVWQDAVRIVRDFPFLGTGLGTFGSIYPRYQTHSATMYYDHAHNDYVELLTDTGITGFGLTAAFAAVYGFTVRRQWMDRHRTSVKALAAGGMASCFAVLVHGLADFNLHIPANAVLLAVILGVTHALVFRVGRE